jgi:hypothetical protein
VGQIGSYRHDAAGGAAAAKPPVVLGASLPIAEGGYWQLDWAVIAVRYPSPPLLARQG